ncbi:hypothetical protein [Streptomyces prasinopilosus]|uniref:hypothetical protein n=1 Tax=Streptomyces prasinopilosus TaxID=67344 RepID=UPI0006EBD3CF|nr:hypothetical protein [Streptomyces prasinopilosus]
MAISAEDQIIHHLKDKVGLARADELVAELKGQRDHEETLRLAAEYLRKKYGVTNRAAGDLLRLAELESQGRSIFINRVTEK